MCGVFGVLGHSSDSDTRRELIKSAISALEHRGPDEWGIYNTSKVGLGHTRLSIIDVQDGHQPMKSDDYVISYNGEIFNYLELREELVAQGCHFNTHSDTEVILKIYQYFGVDGFVKLNGQFAALIWDASINSLVVVRDRLGIRPLYCVTFENNVYFSSEMKAFDTIPGFKRTVNPNHLFEHALFWNTLADKTVYESIRSISAGTYEIFNSSGEHKVSRYYQIGETLASQKQESYDESRDSFKALLADSVKLRLRSDVPVGAYLSGGIDSTVISYMVNEQTNHAFKTFSVAFEDERLDESKYQIMASAEIGSIHSSVVISNEDIDNNISNAIYYGERPVFRTAPVPLHLLSKDVQQHDIKVVLTGEGADEILCGYDVFKELKILNHWKNNPNSESIVQSIQSLYPHLDHYADKRRFGLMKMYYEGFLNSYENDFAGLNIRMTNNKVIANYFNKDLGITYNEEEQLETLRSILPDDYANWTLMQKQSFLELKTLLPGYLLSSQGDRMAMSHSIEGRFPFLDHRVVEKAFAMPDEYKLKNFDQKHILKDIFKDNIPKQITDRPKRPYMAPDLAAFIGDNGAMTPMASDMLSEQKVNEYGLFDYTMIQKFLRKFRRGVPETTGYRDNMIFIFILTSQLASYWIENPRYNSLDENNCKVDISE